MSLVLLGSILILSQQIADFKTITKNDLPLSPLVAKQVVIGGGIDFSLVPSEDRNFDSNKEMPSIGSFATDQPIIKWVSTPTNYIVTDDQMLSIVGSGKNEPIFHELEIIRYREKKPWALITQVYVLLFDHRIFCVVDGDMENDSPEFSCDANLRMKEGVTRLDIGLYMSGTGAFNAHALFDLTSSGPTLIEVDHGGHDH